MIAVRMRIHEKIGGSAGQFLHLGHQAIRNRRHAVVDQKNVIVANE